MELKDLKTFEHACKVERLDPKKVIPDFKLFPAKDRKAMIAHAKLIIINRAANKIANKGKSWSPDWTTGQWDKYYPWFYMAEGSSGFRYHVYGLWTAGSDVGSRLCFISSEAAVHVGKTFTKLYKEYFLK